MKKILAVMLLATGFFATSLPFDAEAKLPGRPYAVYKCRTCGMTIQVDYDPETYTIPHPSKMGYDYGCKKSPNGRHNWWTNGAKMR